MNRRRATVHPLKQCTNKANLVQIKCYGDLRMALIDTGASHSYVKLKYFDYLLEKNPHLKYKITTDSTLTTCLADGRIIQCDKKVVLHLKLGYFSWDFSFWLVPTLVTDVILGLNFLGFVGAVIDLKKQCLKFHFSEKEIPLCAQVFQKPFVATCSEVFDTDDQSRLIQLLNSFSDVISDRIGRCDVLPYSFTVTDDVPVRMPHFGCSPPKLFAFKQIIDKLLKADVISYSKSDYSAPAFLVPRNKQSVNKNEYRMVVNYGELHKKIRLDPYPMPTIDQALQYLGKAKYFSVIDLNSSFHQVLLKPSVRHYTAFSTPWAQFQFNRIPMGACYGTQALSRVLEHVFSDIKYNFVFNYVDDIIIYSSSYNEHLTHIEEVLNRLRKVGLTANPKKVLWAKQSVPFLGYIISNGQLFLNPERVAPVLNFPRPKTVKGVQKFIGFLGYYSRFIVDFATLAAPLNLLKRKNQSFIWESEQEHAFVTLKSKLATAPALYLVDFNQRFTLHVDASAIALGVALGQWHDGVNVPVAFGSRLLTESERHLSAYEKEALACVYGVEKFSTYLDSNEFDLYTDNQALSWLLGHSNHFGKLGRWVYRLTRYRFKIHHVKGETNIVADSLSRMFDPTEFHVSEETDLLPLAVFSTPPNLYADIKEAQKNDSFCKTCINDMKQNITTQYKLIDGFLMFTGKNSKQRKIVVPSVFHNALFQYFHASVYGGHLGIHKTYHKIASHFYWPTLRNDVAAKVKTCLDCQKCKPPLNTKIGMHSVDAVNYVWETVHLDIFGPLTRTTKGNICILILIDVFSKFVMLLPLKNMKANTIVNALTNIVWKFTGGAVNLVTDNATYFRSHLFIDMCHKWAMKYITSSPYYPQGNNVERFNRNLKITLTALYQNKQTLWDEDLDLINIGFNNALHVSTKQTPSMVFFGRELSHPLINIWGIPSPSEPLSDIERNDLSNFVVKHLTIARQKVAANYNKDRKLCQFQKGDKVMCRSFKLPSKAEMISGKLLPAYSGPYVIGNFVKPNTVMLFHCNTGKFYRKAHITHLKNFYI